MIHEMIIIAALSLIVAVLKKRKISNLENIRIKGLGFFILSLLVQSGSVFIASNWSNSEFGILIKDYFDWIHCISYQLILIGIALNIEKRYMKVFFIGTVMNFTVILLNGMKMPVKIPLGMESSWENFVFLSSSRDLIHIIMDENTRLKFLGDIFIFKKPYPFTKAVSLGDFFLLIGFFDLIQMETLPKNNIGKIKKPA
jgi:hypothetical protein